MGYWHQFSYFSVPSGKFNYANLIKKDNEIFGDGNAKNLLGDKRDIGPWVARIIKDPRTLNQKVITYSDTISQNEIRDLIEEKTGEKLEIVHVSLPTVSFVPLTNLEANQSEDIRVQVARAPRRSNQIIRCRPVKHNCSPPKIAEPVQHRKVHTQG